MKVIGNHESTKGILTPRFKKKKRIRSIISQSSSLSPDLFIKVTKAVCAKYT